MYSSVTESAASRNPASENRYGPDNSGRLIREPSEAPAALRFGPVTEPMVVAQMTIDITVPRRSGVASSEAA